MPRGFHDHVEFVLNQALCDLKEEVEGDECCCELKTLDFSQGSPDYTVEKVQKCYLLRYYGGYLCEYRHIIGKALDFLSRTPPKVLSIGCGTCIDARALYFELQSRGKDPSRATFVGYDVTEWYWSELDNLPLKSASLRVRDIAEIEHGKWHYNIVFFPKSLSDIPGEALDVFCDAVRRSSHSADKIVLVSSIRDHVSHRSEDAIRFSSICTAFSDAGYRTEDDPSIAYGHVPLDVAWAKVYPGFSIPDAVVDYCKTLDEQCPTHQLNGRSCETSCGKSLRRWPILRTNSMTFNIVRFER